MKSRNHKLKAGILFLMFLSFFATACENDNDIVPRPEPMEKSIVEIADENSDFSILAEALVKANLISTLEGEGSFTVFAPTNTAFQNLFKDLGVSGISDISSETLTPILLYHVLGIEAKSMDLNTGYAESSSLFTPGDHAISIFVNLDSGVTLNGSSSVTSADVLASNGVIHIIDKVLLPPGVVDLAIANPTFSHLVAAVVKADLVSALSGNGPFTIFAPTDTAFEALFAELGVSGIDELSAETLVPILLYHVVSGNIRASDVSTGMIPTLNESNQLSIDTSSGVRINGSTMVIATDIQGTNGVIHAIDKVLLPE